MQVHFVQVKVILILILNVSENYLAKLHGLHGLKTILHLKCDDIQSIHHSSAKCMDES